VRKPPRKPFENPHGDDPGDEDPWKFREQPDELEDIESSRAKELPLSPGDPLAEWLPTRPIDPVLRALGISGPKKLVSRIQGRSRERALLVDQSRLFMRTLVRLSREYEHYDHRSSTRDWLNARIDGAMKDLMILDQEDERAGKPVLPPYQPRYSYLIGTLGITPSKCRLACIVLNDQAHETRRVFYEAIVMKRPLKELTIAGWGDRAKLESHLRSALRSLTDPTIGFRMEDLRTDPGFEFPGEAMGG
jgi:hypothetical protein